MQTGVPKFNALVVGEGSFSFLSTGGNLECKAAFVDPATGATHGWAAGNGGIWSPETMALLKALKDSMEVDMAHVHFVSEGGQPTRSTAGGAAMQTSGGLGEMLAQHGEDAPPL